MQSSQTTVRALACCSESNSTEPIKGANLTVPLDFTEAGSNNTLQLQLIQIPSLRQPPFANPQREACCSTWACPVMPGGHPQFPPQCLALKELYPQRKDSSTSEYHDLVTFKPQQAVMAEIEAALSMVGWLVQLTLASFNLAVQQTLPFSYFEDGQERIFHFPKNPKAWGTLDASCFWAKSTDNTFARL
ncbi:hypothetical protein LZ30DRAFT_341804 [Colletotrichum cereale]|nr:hypothetical protein LZ30DRAFT_341804 [Colletotrichum cereale]